MISIGYFCWMKVRFRKCILEEFNSTKVKSFVMKNKLLIHSKWKSSRGAPAKGCQFFVGSSTLFDFFIIASFHLKPIKDAKEEVRKYELKDSDEASFGGDEVPLHLLLPVHLRQGGVVLSVRPDRDMDINLFWKDFKSQYHLFLLELEMVWFLPKYSKSKSQ